MIFVLVSFLSFASKALGLPSTSSCLSTLRDGPLEIVALRLKFKIKSKGKSKVKSRLLQYLGTLQKIKSKTRTIS